ncbi:MAG TPA: M56 family metallopeptidase [Longimicrobium sp.]
MTIAWMLGAAAAGVLLSLAGLAAERIAAWFQLPRRWAWAAALGASLLLPLVALAAPGVLPQFHLPSAPPSGDPQPQAAGPVAALPSAPQETAPDVAPRSLPAGVLAGWLAASLAIVAALGMTQRRLRAACGALEPRRVDREPVFVSGHAGPMVLGVIEPRIVLPRWAVDGPEDELRLIVRHEREHVRAGDPWLLVLSALAVAAMPWSPALWWQHRRLRLAVETDCDARVLARGESIERYGRVLLRTAGRGSFLMAGAVAWGSRSSHLEWRILAMTMKPPRNRLGRAVPLAGIALALVAAACGAASRGGPDAPEPIDMRPDAAPLFGYHEGRLYGDFPLDDTRRLVVNAPDPARGKLGLGWRYGDEPRTRNSPPPTVLPTVTSVTPGFPAEAAGVRAGDVLVSVNGRDAREPWLFGSRAPGTAYTVRIRRAGAERNLRLVIGPPPTRAEVERNMGRVAACERRELSRPGHRLDDCFFPY